MRSIFPALLSALLLLCACSRDDGNPAPPRIDAPMPVPALTSTLAIPVTASLKTIETRLDAALPQQLWSIDEVRQDCVAGQRLTIKALGIKKAKITPDIACRITGEATRGRPRLSGSGDTLKLVLPIAVRVNARDANNQLKGETATAQALVKADIRLAVTPEWKADAKVNLAYEWQENPNLEVLGITVSLTEPADKALAKLLPKLEAAIPAELAKLQTRDMLAKLWAEAFTTISINRDPEIWIALAPQTLHVDPWQISKDTITLPLTVRANAKTIIGLRPENPVPTPLPPPAPAITSNMDDTGVSLSLPIIAEYAVLEPILEKALAKLSAKGIRIPDKGMIDVKFGKVSLYPTSRGRLAVGIEIDASSPRGLVKAKGKLWLAGTLQNEPGSQRVTITDLDLVSQTDSPGFNLLVAIADTDMFQTTVADALAQDFSKDLAKLLVKIKPKLAALPIGKSFILNAEITSFKNGKVAALGQGLSMPVEASATARLNYRPAPISGPAPAKTASGPPSKTPPARL